MSSNAAYIVNRPARGAPHFTPEQVPPAGTLISSRNVNKRIPKLFTPLKIRGIEFKNRIFVSPMCQYSAEDGHLTDWHMAHLGGIIMRGPGLTVVEATAVTANGRISPEDSGLWKDSQIAPLKKIVDFAHSQGQKIGIQLGHAGRKASTLPPWLHLGGVASVIANGWPENVIGPTEEQFSPCYPTPRSLKKEEIKEIVNSFASAARRAVKAGFDVIEIHGAHGYLLHSFQSPISNTRVDEYGGTFGKRIRFTLEVVDAVRAVIPRDMPLFYRVSATDWLEESLPDAPSWRIEDTVLLAEILYDHGVDLLDVSSGGAHPKQKVKAGFHAPAYQSELSSQIKERVNDKLLIGTVGGIREAAVAEKLLAECVADVTLVGREFLRRPNLVWDWAEGLGVQVKLANQIEWGFYGRDSSTREVFGEV